MPLLLERARLPFLSVMDFVHQIRAHLPQCLKISSLGFLPAAQPLYPAFLGMVKSIGAPARPMILILLLFKVHPSAWWLNLLMLGRYRSQSSKSQDPICITLPGSALWAILSSRQSAHARVPAILEERAMPMITCIFPLLQTFPSTAFILFLLRLALETLLVLVFIPFEEI
jgi:hypothetical protein